MKKDGKDPLPADQKGDVFMVESAPLFIEYCAQGYVNCDAFNAVIATLLIALIGTWVIVWFVLHRALAQIFPAGTK